VWVPAKRRGVVVRILVDLFTPLADGLVPQCEHLELQSAARPQTAL
jgi:hypothetical protein